jgi:long-chain acyl-CoA synthetase
LTLPRTVADGFLATARRLADAVAIRPLEGEPVTWSQYADRAARVAAGLRAIGVERGDRVMLLMRNRVEFHLADMGAVLAGATPISIYTSSSPEQIAYLVGHSKAKVVIVEEGVYVERVLSVLGELPTLRRVLVVGDAPAGTEPFDSLLANDPLDADAAAAQVDPHDLVTVIYTSGTTGAPKGVMLDHANVVAQFSGLLHFLGEEDGSAKRLVSYLPMAHVAERMVSHYNHVLWGPQVTPCPDITQLSAYLVAVRPHILFGPPRVWEKLYAGINAAVVSQGPETVERFRGALDVGRQVQQIRARGEELPEDLAQTWAFVDEVAFAPLRARVGLDACEVAFSGAAPIPPEVIDFLRDIGVPMSEVYGMSENTGGMTWEPFRVKVGRVGTAFPGNEVVIADDGEVLCRGPIVFRGYLDDPERTDEALDPDGWLHTGDIGQLDEDGYLRIVDRKKELIITAGGKNISPANLEAALKTIPLVGQAAVVGEARPYLVALLALDPETAASRFPGVPLDEVAADRAVVAEIAGGVAEINERFSHAEAIKRFALHGEEWLPDSDVLTPTMKLKRRGITKRYAEAIESLYAGGGVEVEPKQPEAAPA